MKALYLLFLFAFSFGLALGQTSIKTEPTPAREIQLNVSVWNDEFKFRTDLKEENFEVLSNSKPLQVEHFSRRKNGPISVGIILNTTVSMYREPSMHSGPSATALSLLPPVLRGLSVFVRDSNPDNEYFVIRMGEEVRVEVDHTTESSKLINYIDGLIGIEPKGARRSPYEALKIGFDKIANAKNQTRIILLISAASDLRVVNYGFDQVEALARRSSSQLYYVRVWLGGNALPRLREQSLVDDSGGIVFNANTSTNIENIFGIIADELQSQYEIRFRPDPKAKPNKWNKVEVKVSKTEKTGQKLFVKAKRGYVL